MEESAPTWSALFSPSVPTPLRVLALCPEQSPGAADFRALPENAVVVTASPSAVTPLRTTPLVSAGD